MLTDERQQLILDALETNKIVKSKDLMLELEASESTIRRDLQELEAQGLLKRVHGGAKRLAKVTDEPDMAEKATANLDAKKQVARYAASLVHEGDIIYLDAGTATYEMIPLLTQLKDVTVVTNSVYHASLLIQSGIPTLIIGGTIKLKTRATVDNFSLQHVSSLHFDKAFMGINSIHPEAGFTTPDPNEALMKTAAINQSERFYFLVDETKFNQVSFAKVAELDQGTVLTPTLPDKIKEVYQPLLSIQEVN